MGGRVELLEVFCLLLMSGNTLGRGVGSFDVYKSLSESRHQEQLGQSLDETDQSIVGAKKKRAAVIYDSEEEDSEDDEGQLNNSFQVLGASTPKCGPAPPRSRKSVGGNTSVASRRSFIMSVIEDIDLRPTDVADDDDEVSGTHLDEEEILGSSLDEHRWEDSVEETSNEDQEEQEVGSIMAQEEEPRQEEVSFFSLVSRGKQSHSEGKLQEALSFFLRAVDLKPGDPEVQLMTIQLYRRLSERS